MTTADVRGLSPAKVRALSHRCQAGGRVTSTPRRGRDHHGDLRSALIRTGFDLLARSGLTAFSVAQVARELGVSTAAPYRHFPDRDHLLAAVATPAAEGLTEGAREAAAAAGEGP